MSTLVAASFWLHDIFHPLRGLGYQFWSGIAGSFVLGGGVWVGLLTYLRKHNCHQHRCWRLAWHPDPTSGHPVCKKHHPHDPANLPPMRDPREGARP